MLKHLFKLIWKKKKSNALMMLEIFISFLILFAVWSLTVFNYQNYAQPAGIVADQVWDISLNFNVENDSLKNIYRDLIKQKLSSYPEVSFFSFASNNVPYSHSTSSTGLMYQKKEFHSNLMNVETDYPKVLSMKLSEGRWFTDADKVSKNKPIVITKHLRKAMFGNENAVGKLIGDHNDKNKLLVIGVVDNFKHQNDFQAEGNCYWVPLSGWESELLVKVSADATADFEAKLSKELVQLGKDWSIEIKQLPNMKESKNRQVWIPILILFIVCGFLILNVALGLFGVLFQTISRRKQEIGVRRAMGATQNAILWQFIGETAVIATFGVLLGTFFAIQFPLLNVFDLEASVYLMGLLLAIVSVYLIVIFCAFLPSKQASRVYPAIALHEE